MKHWVMLIVFLIAPSVQAGEIRLELHGEGIAGHIVRVALYNAPEQFGSENQFFKSAIVTAEADSVNVVIPDVPNGKYTVSAYVDANRNGKQDRNFFGKPTEAYGFSNNARGTFGPPDYAEALFELDGDLASQFIRLQ